MVTGTLSLVISPLATVFLWMLGIVLVLTLVAAIVTFFSVRRNSACVTALRTMYSDALVLTGRSGVATQWVLKRVSKDAGRPYQSVGGRFAMVVDDQEFSFFRGSRSPRLVDELPFEWVSHVRIDISQGYRSGSYRALFLDVAPRDAAYSLQIRLAGPRGVFDARTLNTDYMD